MNGKSNSKDSRCTSTFVKASVGNFIWSIPKGFVPYIILFRLSTRQALLFMCNLSDVNVIWNLTITTIKTLYEMCFTRGTII